MEKYLDVPISALVVSGETTADGTATDTLTDSTADFVAAGVKPGDIVHVSDTGVNEYVTVVSVDSITALTVSAGVDTGLDFFIHSSTDFNNQLVSVTDVKIIEQEGSDNDELLIVYEGGKKTQLIFNAEPSGSNRQRDAFQVAMTAALRTGWTNIVHPVKPSSIIIGVGIS
jgi:hypothetical protein